MELFRVYFQSADGMYEVEYTETIKRGALSWLEAMDIVNNDIVKDAVKPYLKSVKE